MWDLLKYMRTQSPRVSAIQPGHRRESPAFLGSEFHACTRTIFSPRTPMACSSALLIDGAHKLYKHRVQET